MDRVKILVVVLLCGFTLGASGQRSEFGRSLGEFRRSIGVNTNLSTSGIGADVYWNFMPRLSVRAGYNRLSFKTDMSFHQNNLHINADIRYLTSGLSVGVDYQLLKFMYATAGLGMFRFKPKGKVVPIAEYQFGDIELEPQTMGSALIRVKNCASVSPYLGIGFGRITPSNRFSFAFEMGAYYMGKPKIIIDASGMLAPSAEPEHAMLLSRQISQYRFYPIIKFSLGVKIFTFRK